MLEEEAEEEALEDVLEDDVIVFDEKTLLEDVLEDDVTVFDETTLLEGVLDEVMDDDVDESEVEAEVDKVVEYAEEGELIIALDVLGFALDEMLDIGVANRLEDKLEDVDGNAEEMELVEIEFVMDNVDEAEDKAASTVAFGATVAEADAVEDADIEEYISSLLPAPQYSL